MKAIGIFLLVAILLGAGFAGGLSFMRWRGAQDAAAVSERKVLYWVDPMHPAYKSDKPGIAPDCGMKLQPVFADQGPVPGGAPVVASAPEGTFQVSPEKQQLIGMRFGDVALEAQTETVRASGRVTVDETRISHVHSKIEGWIEKVNVDFTGALVQKGDPLVTIYSPEMLASQQEYLLAIKAQQVMSRGALPDSAGNSASMVDASRRRLELWDLSAAQIDEIKNTGKPTRAITLYAPAGGFVTARNAFPSLKISPETELYTLADLSRVWIMADLFETDATKVRVGATAMVRVPTANNAAFSARVTYVQPQVDPATRTVKVRMEADNPAMRLKPDMFVDVEMRMSYGARVTIPAEAVLDAGLRKTVFVDRGNGYLEPRAVETGDHVGDRVVVLSGLKPGERIVTSGTFLVDSESQLRPPMGSPAAPDPHAGHGGGKPGGKPGGDQ
jgi:membrane fusion protein, copper/silver efflux system